MAHSAWFVFGSVVQRMDTDDAGRRTWPWAQAQQLEYAFPPLALLLGADGGLRIVGGVQMAENEVTIGLDAGGSVRLDGARGAVVLGPPRAWRFGMFSHVVGVEHPPRGFTFGRDAHRWFDRVTSSGEEPHPQVGLDFTLPDGTTTTLGEGDAAMTLPDGRLCLFNGPTFQIFDLAALTTDGVARAVADEFPPLVQPPLDRLTGAFSMTTDVRTWGASGVSGDVPRTTLEVVKAAATGAGLDPKVVLDVAELETGLRADAYRPEGRYGLLAMTADQLAAAGWAGAPGEFLAAAPDAQQPVLQAHLASLGPLEDIDQAAFWMVLLAGRDVMTGLTETTVFAAAAGPHADVFASHANLDLDGDGGLSYTDLNRSYRSRRRDRRFVELEDRLAALG